METWWQDRV